MPSSPLFTAPSICSSLCPKDPPEMLSLYLPLTLTVPWFQDPQPEDAQVIVVVVV